MKRSILTLIVLGILLFTACGAASEIETSEPSETTEVISTQPPTQDSTTKITTEAPTETTTVPTTEAPTETTTVSATEEPTETTTIPTTEEATETTATEETEETGSDYVINTNSEKFHYPSCSSAESIASYNRKDYHGTREELIDMGYVPCKRCNP